MPDSKITALTALTAADPANDMFPIVDVSDTSMAASGTTKRISINNLLAASGTATLASATITGDLTVRTNTLKVDSANNRVGIGTATPNWLLTASGSSPEFVMIDSGGNGTRLYTKTTNTAVFIGASYSTSAVPINFTLDGGSSNAMTLNSTGLGVGVASPAYKLDVLGTGNSGILAVTTNAQVSSLRLRQTQNLGANTRNWEIRTNSGAYGNLDFAVGASQQSDTYTAAMTLDASGNLGIGVTPSAWATYKAVSVGGIGASVFGLGSSQAGVAQGAFFNNGAGSGWAYSATSQVPTYYLQINGENIWNIAPSGTAGAQITAWTSAMKLDASGNLILLSPSTPPTLATNGQLTVNATSNTNLRFSYRGSDGVTRTANLTLA